MPAAAELVKLHDFDVAGWEAAVYGDTETGRFDNCMATGRYEGGVDFHVIVFRDYRWALGFSSTRWNLRRGEIRLGYRFDEGQWFSTEAYMESLGGLVLWDMASDPAQVALFRRSRVMDISIAQRSYSFKLTGTARLVSTLSQCVKIVTDAEKGKVAEKPAAPAPVKPRTKTAAKAKPSAANGKAESEPRSSSGTGFIVSKSGHILTNQHVVQGCTSISVSRTGDIARPVELLRTDITNDLAVLKMEATAADDEIARFRTRSMRAGETIAAYGFPLAGTLSASGNIVSGNVTSLAGLSDDVRLLQISAPVQPGNSGGPLMDNSGAVVGIVNGKLNDLAAIEASGSLPQNVNFSIKANVGLNFLDAHSIPYETVNETAALDLPAIADKARKFTVFIACRR
ncbi:S1C family serine protease [Taklimakanibacter lacteus]|uniref:S1C family serine protease n=1 Tax=Taklimakanibacter lacteus TaxID=2268456 RepID=UPI0013C52D51